MTLKLNWIGIHVSDFPAALRFYTETVGIEASATKPGWAYMETTGMTFELFAGGMPPAPGRSGWGNGQAVRPSIQVADLPGTVAEMRRRGLQFAGQIQRGAAGEWIEFIAPEQMAWTFAQAPAGVASPSLRRPNIGWIELKVDDLAAQRTFYTKVMGLQPAGGPDRQVVLRQAPAEPHLFLVPGGQRATPLQIERGALHPAPSHLMSFETENIEEAAAWLRSQGVPIVIGITRKAWGGIDLYITDPDGNPIQVVQYIRA